jgi:antitoxin YefM
MKIVSYSELKSNLKHWLNSVIDDVEEVVIKRKDQQDLILISLKEYNSLMETNYLLSGKNRKVLLDSISEVKKGCKEYQKIIEE